MNDVIPPHNTDLEKQLIYLMLFHPDTIPTIFSVVTPTDFYGNTNKTNAGILKSSYKEGDVVDFTKIQRIYDYTEEGYISPQIAKNLAEKLRLISKKRSIYTLTLSIQENIEKTEVDKLIGKISKTLSLINSTSKKQETLIQTIEKAEKYIEENKSNEIIGLTTGFYDLDKLISGFQKTHIWVLGGYTNYGKTTVAISMLCNLLKKHEDSNVLFCSLEMSKQQLIYKIASNFTRKTFSDYRRNFNEEVKKVFAYLKQTKLEITDDLFDVDSIEMKIREMEVQGRKPEVVFIDFIQNIQGGHNEYEKITEAMVRLQNFAKQYDLCFVVLSQVNNDSARQKSEVIGFKSTGAIAAVADITIQVIRNKLKELDQNLDHVDMKLVIQKNRHGQGGVIDLDFDKSKGLIIDH